MAKLIKAAYDEAVRTKDVACEAEAEAKRCEAELVEHLIRSGRTHCFSINWRQVHREFNDPAAYGKPAA